MTHIFPRSVLAMGAIAAILCLGACVTENTAQQGAATTNAISAQSGAALQARVAAFEAELNRGRMVAVFDFLPPLMKPATAEKHGLSQSEMRAMMTSVSAMAGKDGKLSGDLDMSQARFGNAANGAPYALIPAMATLGGGPAARPQRATILALQEDGAWYLVPLDSSDTVATVKRLYPEFRSVALSSAGSGPLDARRRG